MLRQLVEVHRVATVHAGRHVPDAGAAEFGGAVIGVATQSHTVVVHRAIAVAVVLHGALVQGVDCLIGGEQLRTVDRVGATVTDAASSDVSDGPLATCRAHADGAGWRGAGEVVVGTGDGHTSRTHGSIGHRAGAQCHVIHVPGLRPTAQRHCITGAGLGLIAIGRRTRCRR
ncbi:hypothetical protein FQZ97_699010 [compost metagenome]